MTTPLNTKKHSSLSNEENHKLHAGEFANAAEREAATGFTSDMIDKAFLQKDNYSIWFLKSVNPVTWATSSVNYATNNEAYAGTNENKSINPVNLLYLKSIEHLMEDQYLIQKNKSSLEILPYTELLLRTNDTNRLWRTTESTILNIPSIIDTGLLSNGEDYSVFIVWNGTDFEFKCSLSEIAPRGYTTNTARRIGGFHTLCASVGSISGHPLSGYIANNILPKSVWCTQHLPISKPNGMVYDENYDIWVDVYLQSGTGYSTKSKYGAVHTTNRTQSQCEDDMWHVKKSLLNSAEYASAGEGSNQQTNIQSTKDWTTVGGHVDTAGRRMISNIGCEEMAGYLWTWLNDLGQARDAWQQDPLGKGQNYSNTLAAGGHWGHGSICGSAARSGWMSRVSGVNDYGGRGRALSRRKR